MDTLWRDLRYAVRVLLKRRGFTAVAVLSLALGIGANTAIFSVVSAVLLRALPFHDPDRLVVVWEDASFAGFPQNTPAPANYVDWKAQNTSFEDMAALRERTFNLTGDAEPEKVHGSRGHGESILVARRRACGWPLLLARGRKRRGNVVVLSYGLWQRRFGGRADIIDQESCSTDKATASSASCRASFSCSTTPSRSGRRSGSRPKSSRIAGRTT